MERPESRPARRLNMRRDQGHLGLSADETWRRAPWRLAGPSRQGAAMNILRLNALPPQRAVQKGRLIHFGLSFNGATARRIERENGGPSARTRSCSSKTRFFARTPRETTVSGTVAGLVRNEASSVQMGFKRMASGMERSEAPREMNQIRDEVSFPKDRRRGPGADTTISTFRLLFI